MTKIKSEYEQRCDLERYRYDTEEKNKKEPFQKKYNEGYFLGIITGLSIGISIAVIVLK